MQAPRATAAASTETEMESPAKNNTQQTKKRPSLPSSVTTTGRLGHGVSSANTDKEQFNMASIKKYATTNGHMWRVQYRSPDGRNRTKQGFPAKAKAQTWADKNAVSIADHDWTDPQLKKQTLAHVAQPWLARIHTLSPSTRRVYTIAWNNHVEPYWGTSR